MDPTILIGERITVAAVFYTKPQAAGQPCRPYKMRFHGRDITFTRFGLYHPTQKGRRAIHVFDMSDSAADYRLEFDADALSWTLVSLISADTGDVHA